MKNKFYITTPAYYSSGNIHIGHVYCTIMCDIIARNKRLRGFETYFLTGADEHGQKIKKNAKKSNLSPKKYVDKISGNFKKIWKQINISNDGFIRTTDEKHIKMVQKMFSLMLKNNDIYLGNYEGWYCVECESFWSNSQVGEKHLCFDCGRPVNKVKEESFFFNCSKYVKKLINFYEKNTFFCYPKYKLKEIINNFIKPGLHDLSVSRISNDWGIQILENKKHTIYVWLDALFNYISALDYCSNGKLYQKFWKDKKTEIVHVVGADISRFHCIYWPMFLMSCKLRLPNKIFVHGLIKVKGEKMSKSKKNSISPYFLIERYGIDSVRYFFAREIIFGCDGEFIPERFIERINNDLSNQLGNLLNRTISMIDKYFNGRIPLFKSKITSFDEELENSVKKTIDDYEKKIDNLMVTEAITSVMLLVENGNKYIELTKPWNLAKNKNIKELESVLSHLSNILYVVSILLSPVLINKFSLILDQLGIPVKLRNYNSIKKNVIVENFLIKKKSQLFPKINMEEEINYINKFILCDY